MNIISKEKKEIRWLGLPTNSIQEANGLELDKAKRIDRIKAKTQQLQDLILQVNYITITYLCICLLNENLCLQNVLARQSLFYLVWECNFEILPILIYSQIQAVSLGIFNGFTIYYSRIGVAHWLPKYNVLGFQKKEFFS